MQRRTWLFLTLLSSLSSASAFTSTHQNSASALSRIQISTLLENDPAAEIAEQILNLAYQRLGITLVVKKFPGERSLYSANNGETDGELYRKIGMERDYPNLVIVPIPLQTYEIVIFTLATDFNVHGWESLSPFVIGYVKGIKIIEQNTKGMRVEPAVTMRQAFLKMSLGRSDVVIANRASGLAVLKELNMTDVRVLKPALASFAVFHYLHKKHQDLVPKLSAVLKQMQSDKSIEDIQKSVLSKLEIGVSK